MTRMVAFGNPVYDRITTPATTIDDVLSGCTTNSCLLLSRLGHDTTLVGRVGPNRQQHLIAEMQRYGVEVCLRPASQTAGFHVAYDLQSNRTLRVLGDAGAIDHLPDGLQSAEAVLLGPILQETPAPLIERIRAHTAAPLFLDPQGLLRQVGSDGQVEHIKNPDLERIAPHCLVLKANEDEARLITGHDPRDNPTATAQRLRMTGCRIAIITLAERGSLIDDGQQQYHIPAYPTRCHDPTGAGDMYMAGFVHAFLQNQQDLLTAGCTGAAAASLWIEHSGPDAPISLSDIEWRASILLRECAR